MNENSWLNKMRKKYGFTQEYVADALGISPRTVLNWENGHHEPKLTIRQTKALCRLFQVSIDEIPDDFPLENMSEPGSAESPGSVVPQQPKETPKL